jgi:undecaprenyl-diphosphatase
MRAWVAAADRRISARLATTDSVVLDQVLPALSRSANYGALWLATSCVLELSGGPYRRAAVRGLLAMGIASFSANVVSKQLVGRTRPPTGHIPAARRLQHAPLTTSFPSGHSASAAAYATGVAIEAPAAAVPLTVLAAAVALSRVTTGAHYPSDVLAGTALGVAVGASSLWWWPRRSA